MTPTLLLLAVSLDSLTFSTIWPAEANPLVLELGFLPALVFRWTAVLVALGAAWVARRYWQRIRPALLVAAYASAFGAATNVATMAAL